MGKMVKFHRYFVELFFILQKYCKNVQKYSENVQQYFEITAENTLEFINIFGNNSEII